KIKEFCSFFIPKVFKTGFYSEVLFYQPPFSEFPIFVLYRKLVFSLFFHKSFRKAVLIYTEEQIIMRRTGNEITRQKDGRRARFPHIDKAGGIQWITIKMITAAMAETRGRTDLAEIIIRL
ncbi:MAG: hypothetical protein LUI13_03070, partial [Lachnospiraceae bacterium]|nr:hypothetical protein [Lachnospiraceae bacterium]